MCTTNDKTLTVPAFLPLLLLAKPVDKSISVPLHFIVPTQTNHPSLVWLLNIYIRYLLRQFGQFSHYYYNLVYTLNLIQIVIIIYNCQCKNYL